MSMLRRIFATAAAVLAITMMATTVSAQTTTIETTDTDDLGTILTDGEGMTLYVFANGIDCTGGCLDLWPALTVESADDLAAGDGVTGELGTVERGDGTMQATYNGMPLYYYAEDMSAGDTNGQGVGDAWYVVPPAAASFDDAMEMSMAGGEMMAESDQEATETPEAGAMAATPTSETDEDEDAEQPETMPKTGSTVPTTVWLAIAGLVALFSAVAFRMRA